MTDILGTRTLRLVIYTAGRTLISKYAWVTKALNPEPIPEPTTLSFVLLGALALLRRRRG
jgi:hypothetical protein